MIKAIYYILTAVFIVASILLYKVSLILSMISFALAIADILSVHMGYFWLPISLDVLMILGGLAYNVEYMSFLSVIDMIPDIYIFLSEFLVGKNIRAFYDGEWVEACK